MTKWNEVVARQDRPINPKDHVCEKHFTENDIVRQRIVNDALVRSFWLSTRAPCKRSNNLLELTTSVGTYDLSCPVEFFKLFNPIVLYFCDNSSW